MTFHLARGGRAPGAESDLLLEGSIGVTRHRVTRSAAMLIKDIMTRHVECVAPENTVQEAARKMRDLDVGPMPVCDNGRLAGMLTDRDIAVRVVAEGQDPKGCKVRDVMTPGVIYCFEDQSAEEAARLMREHQ